MREASRIIIGDVLDGLRSLPDGCVQCCVTSPPYWGLRDYGVAGQIGLEGTPDAFVAKMVEVFGEVRRVLREDGTLWLNLGDSYANAGGGKSEWSTPTEAVKKRAGAFVVPTKDVSSFKPKDLCMMPWRVAMALQADGWWCRSVIVWAKKSPMPESVTDRPTSSWEPIFLLAKSERYFYDAEAVREPHTTAPIPRNRWQNGGGSDESRHADTSQNFGAMEYNPSGRNQRNVWHLGPEPYKEAHFATFPTEIPRRAIKAGTSEKGCCPACGAPWCRVLEKTKITRERPNEFTKRDGEDGTGNHCANTVAGVSARTVGWRPSCECPPADPVPCLVLDPFLGSGTTIAVARELGRHGVGCELNPQYAELARVRIGRVEKPATFVDPRGHDAPLFAAGEVGA